MAQEKGGTPVSLAAFILAGGSGTRFWPRSRRAKPKQVLSLDGDRTMIQQTVARLEGVSSLERVWVITSELLAGVIGEQLPQVAPECIVQEPTARNTAPAVGLAAFLMERLAPESIIGIFPSDHTIGDLGRYREVVRAGMRLASQDGKIVVLGVPPTRPETGYGYIELGAAETPVSGDKHAIPVRRVRRFTEKPDMTRARAFVRSGNYAWNSGMFLWSAKTLCAAIREHAPGMAPALERIAAAWGTAEFREVFAAEYPKCESISIDYAVLEPRSAKGEMESEIYCLPADFEWSDLGSWAALHEFVAAAEDPEQAEQANVVDAAYTVNLGSTGNYVYAPGKAVALVGVKDVVVVETEDSLLITTRDGSQEVGKVVKALKEGGREDLI